MFQPNAGGTRRSHLGRWTAPKPLKHLPYVVHLTVRIILQGGVRRMTVVSADDVSVCVDSKTIAVDGAESCTSKHSFSNYLLTGSFGKSVVRDLDSSHITGLQRPCLANVQQYRPHSSLVNVTCVTQHMVTEASTRAEIMPICSCLDWSSRDAGVEFEPWTLWSVSSRLNHSAFTSQVLISLQRTNNLAVKTIWDGKMGEKERCSHNQTLGYCSSYFSLIT
ncbi:hypothetical protein CSKR_107475 [Clonorchis sinensis]|uniref:Uncharacterized protein n=1 Tax=Clonorchis sinensis TaxID=79923 RepID=A0A419PYG7_CLOSI|nr:hypothetical protein CSKR_107475 [Clonorchis sinensis]